MLYSLKPKTKMKIKPNTPKRHTDPLNNRKPIDLLLQTDSRGTGVEQIDVYIGDDYCGELTMAPSDATWFRNLMLRSNHQPVRVRTEPGRNKPSRVRTFGENDRHDELIGKRPEKDLVDACDRAADILGLLMDGELDPIHSDTTNRLLFEVIGQCRVAIDRANRSAKGGDDA